MVRTLQWIPGSTVIVEEKQPQDTHPQSQNPQTLIFWKGINYQRAKIKDGLRAVYAILNVFKAEGPLLILDCERIKF